MDKTLKISLIALDKSTKVWYNTLIRNTEV